MKKGVDKKVDKIYNKVPPRKSGGKNFKKVVDKNRSM